MRHQPDIVPRLHPVVHTRVRCVIDAPNPTISCQNTLPNQHQSWAVMHPTSASVAEDLWALPPPDPTDDHLTLPMPPPDPTA
eukprot:1160077-Pelagomonas_calceolata.AAC.5